MPQNLVNFGVLPITFADPLDYDRVDAGDDLTIPRVREQIHAGADITVENRTTGHTYRCVHDLSSRQIELIVAGSLITFLQNRQYESTAPSESIGSGRAAGY